MFKTAQEFIGFAKSIKKYDDVERQSAYIAKLFKTPEQFIELKKVNIVISYILSEQQSAYIARLFKTAEDFIKLAEVKGAASHCLALEQSDYIAGLFKTPEQVIKLAKADGCAFYTLAQKQPVKVAGLFKTEEEFNELKEVNGNLADHLREIKNNVELQQTGNLSNNAGRTFFNGSTTGTAPAIPSTGEQEMKVNLTPHAGL